MTEVKRVVHIFPRNLILACNSLCNSLFNTENVIVKGVKGCGQGCRLWSYEDTITLINIWSDINICFEKRHRVLKTGTGNTQKP